MDSQWIQNKKTILKKRNKKEDRHTTQFQILLQSSGNQNWVLAQKKTDTNGVELRAQK